MIWVDEIDCYDEEGFHYESYEDMSRLSSIYGDCTRQEWKNNKDSMPKVFRRKENLDQD